MLSVSDSVPCVRALQGNEIKVFTRGDLSGMHSSFADGMLEEGIQTLCCIPLVTRKGTLGTLNLASREENAFMLQDLSFLKQVAAQVAIALDNARAYREIAELTNRLATEKLYLEDEIRSERNFEEIVGESPALKRVLGQAKTVAPSDATVLILGDTGTGKELIARAIHRMSSRKDASFIKLNCAAIPTGLLESELFGHEKGAFTGAVTQKVGRLELADKGTLFLDEVGDIPLELQPKLLRVLQDHEFERLGGNRTIRVNTRLVAATNRDLVKAVAERDFRSDLFYRLNVFPIRMPALRERGKDIPLLVRYFVQKFARRMNKQIETIPTETMHALSGWEWPGNVRELENFIERSVILSDGPVLNVPLAELRPTNYDGSRMNGTLQSLERDHIVRVLRETGGVIAGSHGAAARLGMKRTTLQSRMLRLGISREEYGE
jgi:formate hydrogenlyase transcriptional activator